MNAAAAEPRLKARTSGTFAYFDKQLGFPDWSGRKVLDFGGNDGGLLLNPDCKIRHEDYYCIDVMAEAIEEGRRELPDAHWAHYNRYNCCYNPGGVEGLPIPSFGVAFDFILAYSVFTQVTPDEMRDLVPQLEAMLAPGGALAFTFIDHDYKTWPTEFAGNNLQWRLERFRRLDPSLGDAALAEKVRGASWCTLIDGRAVYAESNGTWGSERASSYHVYYAAERMAQEFPRAEIRLPVNGEMQHCCVIRKK